MTTLYQTLRQDKIAAMKARDSFRSTLLGTVLGEAEGKAKMKSDRASPEPDDMEMLSVIDACMKTARENFEKYGVQTAGLELAILSTYKPAQMNDFELTNQLTFIKTEIVGGDAASMKHMGPILATMKSRFGGQYDPQKASAIVKGLLA